MRMLLVVVSLTACGPGLSNLVAEHHYREAICGAHDGSSGDREQVAASLARDANTAVHVHVIRPAELAPVLGDATASVTERARFVQVRAQTNVLPVDGIELEVELTDGVHRIGTPVSWEALANITGERLPPQHATSTYATGGNVLRGLAAVMTGGASLLFTRFQRGTRMVNAPDSEYRALAPLAHALFHAIPESGCRNHALSDGAGARCTWFLAILPDVRSRLQLAVRYTANRKPNRDDLSTHAACSVEQAAVIELGTNEDIQRTFGARYRTLAELGAK